MKDEAVVRQRLVEPGDGQAFLIGARVAAADRAAGGGAVAGGAYRMLSMPLRLMTLSSASAAPVGRLVPRSSCDT